MDLATKPPGNPVGNEVEMKNKRLLTCVILVAFSLAGCGGGSSPGHELAAIAITPSGTTLAKGLSQQFKATGTFADGSTADLTSGVTWNSTAVAVATVNATSGLVTAIAVGSARITASVGAVSGATNLTVGPAALQSIAVSPNPVVTGIGISRPITATATLSDGSAGGDITASVTWATTTPSIATAAGATVTGASLGSTSVTATLGAITGSSQVTVTSNVWSATASTSVARHKHTATLLPSGKVLAAGGYDGSNALASAEIYDPVAFSWSSASSMATARSDHTATLLPNGKVLIVGGGGSCEVGAFSPGALASAEIYDPVTNAWSSVASMATARTCHTATLLPNGKVLIAGGADSYPSSLASAEIYDPGANSWSSAGTMITARAAHTATLLPNGRVLVAGGDDIVYPSSVGNTVMSTEIYDPIANAWSAGGNLIVRRYFHTATLLQNGVVLIAGGSATSPIDYLASAEIYDPVANISSATASMATARYYHTTTVLADGKVLVNGGFGPDSIKASAEIFDPTLSTWSSAASMAFAREFHTATLLHDNSVLVVGGPANCELYW
jgi:N-acetylneuraminic acid mutarotase